MAMIDDAKDKMKDMKDKAATKTEMMKKDMKIKKLEADKREQERRLEEQGM